MAGRFRSAFSAMMDGLIPSMAQTIVAVILKLFTFPLHLSEEIDNLVFCLLLQYRLNSEQMNAEATAIGY